MPNNGEVAGSTPAPPTNPSFFGKNNPPPRQLRSDNEPLQSQSQINPRLAKYEEFRRISLGFIPVQSTDDTSTSRQIPAQRRSYIGSRGTANGKGFPLCATLD